MVSADRRMLSAISFGVFCRLAPFDELDHAIEEALARVGGHADADLIGEHGRAAGDGRAVAARLADAPAPIRR